MKQAPTQIVASYVVKDQFGKFQILYQTFEKKFYLSSNGGFGQRDMYITEASEEEAADALGTMIAIDSIQNPEKYFPKTPNQ